MRTARLIAQPGHDIAALTYGIEIDDESLLSQLHQDLLNATFHVRVVGAVASDKFKHD
jgi:hypothetical protein